MASCSVEQQLQFWIYNLETACKMADDAGAACSCVACQAHARSPPHQPSPHA